MFPRAMFSVRYIASFNNAIPSPFPEYAWSIANRPRTMTGSESGALRRYAPGAVFR
ncbi:hypothetical protein CH48_4237 (plasmid) [Yersinia enterocolitica]|nr:hypothetical protein CH48_4237 [Yersinia enterocolitica]KGA75223.1 hypothetical protein DJ61_3887 [Yersinia enterocolitica]